MAGKFFKTRPAISCLHMAREKERGAADENTSLLWTVCQIVKIYSKILERIAEIDLHYKYSSAIT